MKQTNELPIFKNPTYSDFIPSSGKEYSYRPYLVKEESILQLAKESKDPKNIYSAIRDVLKACTLGSIEEKDLITLPIFDIKYFFMKLRCVSVGESITVRMKCEDCDEGHETTIPIDGLKIDKTGEKDNNITLDNGIGLVLRYPSLKSTIDSSNNSEKKNPLIDEAQQKINDVLLLYGKCIKTVYQGDEVFDIDQISDKGILSFLNQFRKQDLEKIQEFLGGMPSFKTDIKWSCPKCDKENEFEVDDIETFFT